MFGYNFENYFFSKKPFSVLKNTNETLNSNDKNIFQITPMGLFGYSFPKLLLILKNKENIDNGFGVQNTKLR